MTASLIPTPVMQFFDSNGDPLSGGKVYTYAAGTSTPLATYTDQGGATPNANPVILDSRGEAAIWFGTSSYKLVLKTSVDVLIWTADNVTAALAALAASSGSSLVGFLPAGTGAVATTAQAKMRESVSVFDFMTAAQVADVKAFTYTLDVTAAIQAAIDAASTAKVALYVPGGGYKLVPATPLLDETGGYNTCAFAMKSNMHIYADKGATFKIANSISTDATPKLMSMFFSNSVLSDISIRGLTMDMNGANNSISPSRPTAYNLYTQAHIIFSGTPAGVAARADDVFIYDCEFINTAGVTCIGMMQSNTASVTLGKRWIIQNCLFENNGLDTVDHSSIFGWSEDVLCIGNTFTSSTPYGTTGGAGGGVGANVAYEIHGANTRFIGNKVKNYFQGMWLATNLTSDVDNIIVSDNTFSPISGCGIDVYRQSASESAIKKVIITNNTIGLDDFIAVCTIPSLKTPFQINSAYAISDILIEGNICSKVGTVKGSAFLNFGACTVAANKHTDIVIKNNVAIGMTLGVNIVTNATNGLGYVEVSGNTFKDFVPANTVFLTAVGIGTAGAGAIDWLVTKGNTMISQTGTWQYGMYLTGAFTYFYNGLNTIRGMATSDYTETALTVTTREGFHERIAWTPTLTNWTNVGSPTFSGSYYSVREKSITLFATVNAATSISAVLLTATITNLPKAPLDAVSGSMVQLNNGVSFGNCLLTPTASGTIYPQTTGVLAAGQLGFSFTYNTA